MSDVNNTPPGAEVVAATEAEAPAKENQAETAAPENEERTAPKGVQKRIDELTQLRRQAERDRDHWRELAMRGQQQAPAQQPTPQAEAPSGKPTLEQFGFDQAKYLDALTDWKLEERVKVENERKQAQERQKQQQATATTLHKTLQSAASKYEDFAEVVGNPALPLPMHVVEAAVDLGDAAGDVLYYLGQNPEKAAEIAGMSERRAAIALAKIEAQLVKPPSAAPVAPAAPQVSKAPPPPAAVGNRTTVAVDPMKLSADEWRVQRNKEIAAKQKALMRRAT